MFSQFINDLKEKLDNYTFSDNPHTEIAPYRKQYNPNPDNLENIKKAGVLINFYPKNEELYFVLIERTTYKGTHSNQISLPGGKIEDHDRDIFETAIREASEEVNINPSDVEVLLKLTEVFIPPSNFLVTPVLSFSNKQHNFIPENREVNSIIEVKLNDLLDPQNFQEREVFLNNKLKLNTPCFILNDHVVWGATSMILNELRHILK